MRRQRLGGPGDIFDAALSFQVHGCVERASSPVSGGSGSGFNLAGVGSFEQTLWRNVGGLFKVSRGSLEVIQGQSCVWLRGSPRSLLSMFRLLDGG